MLSRVAERVYWMGRYMERMENIARMINVNTNLMLDLPNGSKTGWLTLVDIIGSNEEFTQKEIKNNERDIMHFLISDTRSSCSIISSLRHARENARTTREIMPSEAWELINDLYLSVSEDAALSISRSKRNAFLRLVVERAQQFTGLLAGTLSQTSTYDFIRLGCNLERADMTSRIVDVGSLNLIDKDQGGNTASDTLEPFFNILWMNVLQSLSAYQMYRQHVLDRVNGEDVVCFLLQDEHFPRSVASCLDNLRACSEKLPNNSEVLRAVGISKRRIDSIQMDELLLGDQLHEFNDTIQQDIASIHKEIAAAWFIPAIPVADVKSV